ncbi:hypothetical protein DXG01_013835 [Tephrocybe rancida]|nr:hypothetical protein DXG01_013835 [Tephrocybe rancida]
MNHACIPTNVKKKREEAVKQQKLGFKVTVPVEFMRLVVLDAVAEHTAVDNQAAPGKVSCTADGWTADTTKMGYLGMTAHWIEISDSGWGKLRAEVVGFQLLHGTHTGSNLGHYFMGLCDCLYTLTLDNTLANDTMCETHKLVYILALFLHPYFKLHYIKIAWGGPEEQRAEFDKGNLDVKDWVDEAHKIVKCSLETYWTTRPTHAATPATAVP